MSDQVSVLQAFTSEQIARAKAVELARFAIEATGESSSAVSDPTWLMVIADWILGTPKPTVEEEQPEVQVSGLREPREPAKYVLADRTRIGLGTTAVLINPREGGPGLVTAIRVKVTPDEQGQAKYQRSKCLDDGLDVPVILDVIADAGDAVDGHPTVVVPHALWRYRIHVLPQPAAGEFAMKCDLCQSELRNSKDWTQASLGAWLHADDHYAEHTPESPLPSFRSGMPDEWRLEVEDVL